MLGCINAAYRKRRRAIDDNNLIVESVLAIEELEPGSDEEIDDVIDVDSIPDEAYKKIDTLLDRIVSDPHYDDSEIDELMDDDEDLSGTEITDEELDALISEAVTDTGWNTSRDLSETVISILFPTAKSLQEAYDMAEEISKNSRTISTSYREGKPMNMDETVMTALIDTIDEDAECPACFPGVTVKNSEVDDFPGVKDDSDIGDFSKDIGDEDGYYGSYHSYDDEIEPSVDNGDGWDVGKNGDVNLENVDTDFWDDISEDSSFFESTDEDDDEDEDDDKKKVNDCVDESISRHFI